MYHDNNNNNKHQNVMDMVSGAVRTTVPFWYQIFINVFYTFSQLTDSKFSKIGPVTCSKLITYKISFEQKHFLMTILILIEAIHSSMSFREVCQRQLRLIS